MNIEDGEIFQEKVIVKYKMSTQERFVYFPRTACNYLS